MATKAIVKAGAKPGKLAKKGGGESWDAKMAKYAKKVDALAPPSGTFASIKDGLFIGGKQMEDNKAQVIVLAFVAENNFHPTKYDKDNPLPPSCYALGCEDKSLVPAENAKGYWDSEEKSWVKPETCADCPMNQYGSAEQGSGKACKNTRRVAFISSNGLDTADKVAGADLVQLQVPPTCIKPFGTYARNAKQLAGHPMFCLTEVRAVQEDWDMVYFDANGVVDQVLGEALEARHLDAEQLMLKHAYKDYPHDEPPRKVPGKPGKGKPGKQGRSKY